MVTSLALTRGSCGWNREEFWSSEEAFHRISWLPGVGGLITPILGMTDHPRKIASKLFPLLCVEAVPAVFVRRTSSTSVATWFWQTEGCVRNMWFWVPDRVHLVGEVTSFEKNFYRLPFTPPLCRHIDPSHLRLPLQSHSLRCYCWDCRGGGGVRVYLVVVDICIWVAFHPMACTLIYIGRCVYAIKPISYLDPISLQNEILYY
jgi:hypothetical protein